MSCRSFEEQIHNFTIYKLPISLIKLTRDEVATTVDKLLTVSAAMTTFVNLPHNSQHIYTVLVLCCSQPCICIQKAVNFLYFLNYL